MQSYYDSDKGAKNTNRGAFIMTASIKSTCARNTCISNTYTMSTQIGYFGNKNTYTEGIYTKSSSAGVIEPRVIAEIRITLVDLGINNCYL